ncbi:GDP-L-fucose synthase family protein [Clostridium butyricum]|uniref:GDP-L-fucose synthase family protein n=1 Tax=Clostridium butyricum TaxID=1492 RepID=UPI0013D7DB31|nr:GDP-L-fucose synthase [Clostridium butyricum]MCQ2022241.1 GDP-L-fucose synthase [Clostridium butyricum]NFB70107.1 GDP-L-fucose synthase [Clostridium butyricum]NFB89894.1 GDP-L-fucose synthase [Clostridium butyricum]
MNKESRIYIAGHKGLIGSNIVKVLRKLGYNNLILKTHKELDLIKQQEVNKFFEKERPEYIFLCAAMVGGIGANYTMPVEFLYDNLMIQNNIIKAAYDYEVKKLLFLGSSCIYPRNCKQPMKEKELLSGYLEPTNEAYAIAKIAGLKLCEYYNKQYGANFISCMPTNIYGPSDNFDIETSHVIPAMIRRFDEAKTRSLPSVEIWGTGKAMREFLYVEDLAEACIFLMDNYNKNEFVNVGTGKDVSIKELAIIIKDIVGYSGNIIFNANKPDGNPKKLLDITKCSEIGWKFKIELRDGLERTFKWYKDNIDENNRRGLNKI